MKLLISFSLILSLTLVKGQDQTICQDRLHKAIEAVAEMDSLDFWLEEGYDALLEQKVLQKIGNQCEISDTLWGDIYHKIGVNLFNRHSDIAAAMHYYQKTLRTNEAILEKTHAK
ncbi:MAG: hypothetical protein AAFR59_13665, partial [Bacteroidota bacterium]